MKKTKINFGAILLIVYAVMSFVLSRVALDTISVYADPYGGVSYNPYYAQYQTVSMLNTVFGVNGMSFTVMAVIIAFSAVLLCGKRWGSIGMGAAMATATGLGTIPFFIAAGSRLSIRFEWSAIIIPAIHLLFIALLGFLGWVCYAASGLFSAKAEDGKKKSVAAIILKIVSAPLVALSGLNQLIFMTVTFITDTNMSRLTFEFILKGVICPYGIIIILALASLLILAAGIILSVKCSPRNMPEIKAKEEVKIEKKAEPVTE